MTRSEHVRNLRKALKAITPQSDAETPWLRHHRPSVAFMLCICYGPWKFPRRKAVQTRMLAKMGSLDLMEMTAAQLRALPLQWQRDTMTRTRRWMRKHFPGRRFDDVFVRHRPTRKRLGVGVESFSEIMRGSITKTVYMFVRDYWLAECFPIDRHVRRWCAEHKLPARSDDIVDLFNEIKQEFPAPLRAYARSVFGEHSSNPIHPTQ
jgi:hypothetical protein